MAKINRRLSYVLITILLIMAPLVGCTNTSNTATNNSSGESPQNNIELKNKVLILSTTTSTENSGLLAHILPIFEEETGISVKVVAVGTGQALKMGEDGEADVLLVHARAAEEKFVEAGHGVERFDVMYNDFVLIGPQNDPLNLSHVAKGNINKAMELIYNSNSTFISRGDDSGTHKMELALWEEIKITPEGNHYVSAGQGMGAVIQMANEFLGYTLTDRATYLSMMDKIDLVILIEGDEKLFNQYGIIAVNPEKNSKINHAAANIFIDWMLSEAGQNHIREFGKDKFGQSLFIPNAKR